MTSVYLIHFDKKLHHAQHYIGYTSLPIEVRMARHLTGDGAKLLRALNEKGITWRVVRIWNNGDHALESRLKSRKDAASLCPVCRMDTRVYEGVQPLKMNRFEAEIMEIIGTSDMNAHLITEKYIECHPRARRDLPKIQKQLDRMVDSGLIDTADGDYRSKRYLQEITK